MTPLQNIAMGLVFTLVDTDVRGFDAVPDVLGWVLVVLGLRGLRDRMPGGGTLLWLGVLAGVVSLALVHRSTLGALPESTGWLLSLAQIAFSFLLCREVADLVVPRYGAQPTALTRVGEQLARRFRLLSGAFVVAAVGPVLLYGGGIDWLLTPLAVITVVSNVYLVYLLFRTSSLLHPRPPKTRAQGEAPDDQPGLGRDEE